MSEIVQLEDRVDTCVAMLVEKVRGCAEREETVDVAVWMQWGGLVVVLADYAEVLRLYPLFTVMVEKS